MFEVLRQMPDEFRRHTSGLILQDKVVAADFSNVADYYVREVEGPRESPSFPQCKPPWPLTWIEVGSHFLLDRDGEHVPQFYRAGVVVRRFLLTLPPRSERVAWSMPHHTAPVEPPDPDDVLEAGETVDDALARLKREYDDTIAQAWNLWFEWQEVTADKANLIPGCESVVSIETCLWIPGRIDAPHSVARETLFLDALGDIIELDDYYDVFRDDERIDELSRSESLSGLKREWWDTGLLVRNIALLGFSLSNCSNVDRDENALPRATRRRLERGPAPEEARVTYRTLHINPMTEQGRRAARRRGESGEADTRLHICRGHFKDYRKKGLFGKYRGIYWWESHLRGSEKHGRVHKDYAVESG